MKETNERNKIVFPAITFLCLLTFQILLNSGLKVPHSIPDEFGSMKVAAGLAGLDWNMVFDKSGLHYGSGTTLPFFFLFYLIKDPTVLYRTMLAVGCLWRTLPVFVIFPMARDYFGINDDWTIVFMSIASILGTPTRGSVIDNEPMLILTGWLSAYLILKIMDRKNQKSSTRDLMFLALVLIYSFFAHQRAVGYIIAAVMILVFSYSRSFKMFKLSLRGILLNLAFLAGLVWLIGLAINSFVIREYGSVANNSLLAVLSWTPGLLSYLFSWKGMTGFVSLILSNAWATYVYYCGMIGILFLIVPLMLIKKSEERSEEEYAILKMSFYPLIIFITFLIGLGIIWNGGPQETIDTGAEMSRGYFYLRYIGSTFGLCLFLTMGYLMRYGFRKLYLLTSLFFSLFVFRFTYSVSLKKAFENDHFNGDAFCFFGPLSFSDSAVYNNGKTATYYIVTTVVASLLLALIYITSKKGCRILIPMMLSAVMVYQYSYIVAMKDYPDSEMYFSFVDKLYEVKTEYPECFYEASEIYYCSEHSGIDNNTQIILMDIPLIPDYPDSISENMVLLTNNQAYLESNVSFDLGKLDVYCLDENETIYTNCPSIKECLSYYLDED